jgi:hypothetical protein
LKIFSGIIIVRKGQGAPSDVRRKIMVEATEGCNFNRGKPANRGKSTKFEKQILSTYITTVEILKKLTKSPPKDALKKFVNNKIREPAI